MSLDIWLGVSDVSLDGGTSYSVTSLDNIDVNLKVARSICLLSKFTSDVLN